MADQGKRVKKVIRAIKVTLLSMTTLHRSSLTPLKVKKVIRETRATLLSTKTLLKIN